MPTSFVQNRKLIVDKVKELNPKSILDIGVGWGVYGYLIKQEMPDIILDGVEVWDYDEHDYWKNYEHIFRVDATDFDYPEYDLYLMIDIIEHLSKEDAYKLLEKLNGKVLISTPIDYPQENMENPFENHISKWTLDDFKDYKFIDYSNEFSIIILLLEKK